MVHFKSNAAVAALCLFAAVSAAPNPPKAAPSPKPYLAAPYLGDLARAAGKKWFGTAADIPGTAEQTDATYLSIFEDAHLFNGATPANMMKYMYTEPEQGVFNYTGGDYFLNIAERTGKIVRCHNLVWVSELPDWVNNGNWTAETLNAVMENHITNLIEHWGDKCYSWDVVNEALNGDGTFSSSIWYDTIGEDYFYNAFAAATKAVKKTGKDIKLYYNDYGLENPGTKTTAAYNLVKELRKRGSKIDGVGLESHFEVGLTPSTADQVAAKQGFIDLGLEVAITELDVRFTQAPYYDLAGEYQQSLDYASAVASCVEVGPKCVGITVWDFVDTYSWVPASFAGQGGATLLNDTYQRKPSWNSVAGALLGWQ